ncbi:FemAB family XrtA/PEP-CTERM system-associated protein [Alterisphingorhabdus coralli]|uniref:FemAB family PEP-CTERM system-associated protein n=1 Tax=Alterisphingorhabdus coralli TaxID=3071408 RepID=A0AA97F4B2_9SPHN|nr:FemAB family XrtA/PEP-CTERM system-associated protein [Parasphingorhabdus sp. SCSIO 66989]WOE73783.1 FemAB family PEP-CTERM system-associated protein [Parasphingorhabdus sp. SCSIO 66989]
MAFDHSLNATSPCSVETVRADDAKAREPWVDYVNRHDAATAFHRLEWIDAISEATGHESVLLIARDTAGAAVRGILPCHLIHSSLFGRALVSCGFAVDGGVLADDAIAGEALTDAMWQIAEQRSCPTVELRGGMMPVQPEWHCNSESYLGFARDLAADDEAELLAIPRKQRAEVRKALKLQETGDLSVETGSSERDRDWHYRVYSESVRNLGTPVFPRALFSWVLDHFGEDADILTVLHQGEPVASVLSLYHRGTVMPYWGGGVWQARQLRANDLMYYALMNHARERGCSRFDFGRSKTGTGAAAFKKNWGFEGQPLHYATRTADGAAPRDVNPLSPKYQARIGLWQKLPLSVANRLGPLIAKGLG